MKTSIKEVAKLAGVSVATVSHVLNDTKPVRTETRKRVVDAVSKLNYQVNPMARNLRKGESKMVGFVVANLTNYYYHEISRGLEERLLKDGYRPVLIDSKEEKSIEIENVKDMLASSVDALVIAPTTEDCSYLNFLLQGRKKRIPIIFVDRKPTGYDSDLIMATNEHGAYEGVMHLLAKGHRQIAFFGSRFDPTMNERLEGYKRALTEYDVPVNQNYIKLGSKISVTPKELRHGSCYRHARDLLETHPEVTAIFSGNNLATIGVYTCIREKNLRVPEDIAFMTFDDSFWLTMTTPSISAIAQDPEEFGRMAGDIIFDRLKQDPEAEQQHLHIRVATKMILRESC